MSKVSPSENKDSKKEISIFLNKNWDNILPNLEEYKVVDDGYIITTDRDGFRSILKGIYENLDLSITHNFGIVIPPIIGDVCKCCGRKIKD